MLPTLYQEYPQAFQKLLQRHQATSSTPVLARRAFLKVVGTAGFALGAFPLTSIAQGSNPDPAAELKPTQQPSAFVQITPAGDVIITINRLEVGQGVQTALPMLLAEELDADWSRVKTRQGNTEPAYVDPVFGMHLTGGSTSLKNSFSQYRELGARARQMLLTAAAGRWKVDVATLTTREGFVLDSGGRKLSYGELAKDAEAAPVPKDVVLKEPKDFRIIGKPINRLDSKAKSSGLQEFGIDLRLPGQLVALLVRPPVLGARLKDHDDVAARAVKGVRAVLRVELDQGTEGLAVIADGYWAAQQGRNALKANWDTSKVQKVDTAQQVEQYKKLASTVGSVHFDADIAPLGNAPHLIDADFVFPYLAHAALEPLNCTVRFNAEGAEIWVGTHSPGLDAAAAARILGLKPEQVRVYMQTSGGSFGRRSAPMSDYIVDACGVAKAARSAGIEAPIKTMWSREDDMRGGYYRPLHVHRARIGFDAQGRIQAWDHVIVGQSILNGTIFAQMLIKNGVDITAVEGMREPYPIPMRLSAHHPKVNVTVNSWRSVGSTHTAFVMETLIDEIARTTKQDPVAYRVQLLGDKHPRHQAALELAVQKSGYRTKSLQSGRAWGVALHESFGSVVAYIVEASIEDGRPKLHRVTAGVHCNLVVNPRSLEAQVQGAVVMGLSTCMPGNAITHKDGVVEQSNFGDYPVARITDMPVVQVHAVPSSDPPTGMGEPGVPPLAPAFANAIAALTGKYPRALPFEI